MRPAHAETIDDKSNDPLVWLLTLEMARAKGDFERAAHAKRELERLGVKVSYHRPETLRRKAVRDAR